MAVYLIGDVQGCDDALGRLLGKLAFSPSRDTVYLLGDLVNRGPDSVAVLRRLMGYGQAAQCVLGNHDLHALAVYFGARHAHRSDTLAELMAAPDLHALVDWLRSRDMAIQAHGTLMVHAGVLPQWTAKQTLNLAGQVCAALRGPGAAQFLGSMYGDSPESWANELAEADALRVTVNALTRLRFCTSAGAMEFKAKGGPSAAPAGYLPWFDVPGRQTAKDLVAFGHWSTLGLLNQPKLLSLDTGCAWGGMLTAVHLRANGGREVVQVPYLAA